MGRSDRAGRRRRRLGLMVVVAAGLAAPALLAAPAGATPPATPPAGTAPGVSPAPAGLPLPGQITSLVGSALGAAPLPSLPPLQPLPGAPAPSSTAATTSTTLPAAPSQVCQLLTTLEGSAPAGTGSSLAQVAQALGCSSGGGSPSPADACPILATLSQQLGAVPNVGSTLQGVVAQIQSALGCATATAADTAPTTTTTTAPAPVTTAASLPATPAPVAVTQAANFTG